MEFKSSFVIMLINKAKVVYPLGYWYHDRIEESDMRTLEKECYVTCQPYMNGSAMYRIRWKNPHEPKYMTNCTI